MIQVWGLSSWNYEIVINSDGKNHQRNKSLFFKMLRIDSHQIFIGDVQM